MPAELETRSSLVPLIAVPLLFAVVPLVCIPVFQWYALTPEGDDSTLITTLFFMLVAVAAVPVFVASVVGLAFSRVRRCAAVMALCSLAYVLSAVAGWRVAGHIRTTAFHSLAERSKPLIGAIREFERKNGHPPETLQALVPEFISSVPSTDMGAYPEYRYINNATNHEGNPWVLLVFTPAGGMNFDQFMYFPLTNYPASGYGGPIERIGDWAYVHE